MKFKLDNVFLFIALIGFFFYLTSVLAINTPSCFFYIFNNLLE